MNRKNKLAILLLFFLLKFTVSFAQIDTAFWFAAPWVTPDHYWKDNIAMHINGVAGTTVHIRQPNMVGPNKYDTTFQLPASGGFDYIFWKNKLANSTSLGFDFLETRPANTVLPYGLHVSAGSNITIVYDVITRPGSFLNPETFSLKGQNGLGFEFVCPFQTRWRNQFFGSSACGSNAQDLNCDGIVTQPKQQINIVTSQPNTVVWITPKTNIIGHLANITYSILLPAAGDVYTLENTVQNTNVVGNNLSGTIIVSDKRISVTVADDSVSGVTGCFDLMGDQIVPVDVVGKNYILNKGFMNAAEHEGAYVVATENFTKLTINDGGTPTNTLINKGDTYHYKTNQTLTYVNADKNVYCLHASGTGCELGEALLPPLECAGSNLIGFSRNNGQGFYLNILIAAPASSSLAILSSFTLNNAAGTATVPIGLSNFTFVPGTGIASPVGENYYGCQLNYTNTSVLPVNAYTISNTHSSTPVFALGVFGGNANTGGLFHYMSAFIRKPTVAAQPTTQVCASTSASVILTGTVVGGTSTGNWSTSGSGVFGAYTSSLNIITVPYFLSLTDTLLSTIPFTLTSVDVCGRTYTTSTFVKVNQRPQILAAGSTTVCKNATSLAIILTGTVSNALGASWLGGNGGSFAGPGVNTTYNPSPSDLSVGTITLTLLSSGPLSGCLNSSKSVTVSFINPPVVDAGANIPACTNSQSVTLGGSITSGTSNTVWATNGTGLFNPNNSTPNAVYFFSPADLLLPSLSFSLNAVAIGGGCGGSPDFMQITIIPRPFVAAPADFTVCATSTLVALTGTIGGSASTGAWSTFSATGAFTQLPPSSSTYTISQNDITTGSVNLFIYSTDGICPKDSDFIEITIKDVPNITIISNNINICKNAPINLGANIVGGISYTWVPQSTSTGSFSSPGSAGMLNPAGGNAFAQYIPGAADIAGSGLTFTILVGNPPCAPSQNSVTANFISSPKALFNFPNLGRCIGASIPITNASLDNGTAPLTYSWNFGATTNSTTSESIAQNPIYTYTNIGSYIITLTTTGASPNNCPDTLSKRIVIYPLPIPNFTVSSACQNINSIFQNLSIVPGGGGSVTAMSWNFGDSNNLLNTPLTSTVAHIYANPGPYNASFTITTNLGCKSSTTIPITINSQPKAEFGLTNNPAVAQEPIYFSDFSTPTGGITNWVWNFGDETSGSGNAPSHSFQSPGIYIIKLTVFDGSGCSDTISKSIEISLLPQVPSGFTPNNDNNNDLLFVKGGPFNTMLFRVYNNWGELLFETADQKIGWDGKKNGVDQPVGVYVWTLDVEMYNNRQVKKNGDITLIR